MGLDITIREYRGVDDKGYLIMKEPEQKLPYTTDRVAVRHLIGVNIDFKTLTSDDKYCWEEYYRPEDFSEAYKWCETLRGGDREYIKGLLDSLSMNENYWLDYGY